MRILIADDHELVRRGVRSVLRTRPDIDVCGDAIDGLDAIEQARLLSPDLIVMDISMPTLNGLEATREIRRILPEIDILILSQHNSPEMMRQALNAGARGYVVKTAISEDLLDGIEKLRRGQLFFAPSVSGAATPNVDSRDISIRNRAERAMNLLAAIVDSSDDAIISKNLDGVITSWNKGAERLFGYTAEEAIGQHITLIIPLDRRDEERDILARLKRGERVDHFETVRIRKDRTLLDISLTISPVKDAAGCVVGASKVARDITERRQVEQALAERALLLDLSNDAILVRDGADRITYWNKSASELYGYTREEALGRVTHELLHTEFPDPLERITEQLRSDSRWTGELVHRRKDGNEIVVMSRWVLNRDDRGNRKCVLETNNDITQQKQSEKALRESENRLRTLTDTLETQVRIRTEQLLQRNAEVLMQSEQLRDLSHRMMLIQDEERRHIARELHDSAGQLLTVLAMDLSTLVRKTQEIAPEIAESAEEARELVHQLTSEIRTTSYLLHPPLLDEEGLEAAISWYVRGLTERSGLDIAFNISERFGRLPREMELAVFRLVQECLTNIHRHSGSKRALIEISRAPEQILLEVRDEGKGISSEKLAEIQSRGTGVGIRGMRERVCQFKGEMTIESSGLGTSFRVTIPVSARNEAVIEETKIQTARSG